MSVHDENDATAYRCKNCNKIYTDHCDKDIIERHNNGSCLIKKDEPWLGNVLKDIRKKRVAVVGSRNYNNRAEIFKYLDSKIDKIGHLVSGGCPSGADAICQQYAKDKGLSITIHYPDWDGLGKRAGFARNRKIVEDCDVLIAFTTGSKGTQNSIDLATKLGKKVIIHKVEPDKE